MFEKILIVTGAGAAATSPAVRRGASLGARTSAQIELFGVVYDPHLEGYLGHAEVYTPLRERLVAERRTQLEATAAELRGQGLGCAIQALWAHSAAGAVARESVATDAELVVMEPQGGDGGFSHEDWRVLSTCPVPVLVARGPDAPYSAVVAAVDPSRSHGKPPGLDAAILQQAETLRRLYDAKLEVLHCFTPLTEFAADSAFDGVVIADVQHVVEADRREDVNELVERAGLPAASATVVEGRPAVVLADRSEARPADLVVLGTVSRGPVERFLLGSTAERVLRAAGGDVLVIKPPGFPGFTEDG